ncbi:MAG: type II toxin-antitoxin system Phd/YefM family antitoxin [Saprospiraceae bacterium]|nr:type II toxin-antitoxin system Phd/YefM family antitoxin [Saprospiraceae bacterium]
MLVVSSREFRQNQKLYFDKVDEGEQVIVQRGGTKSYVLMPVKEQDLYFNEHMIAKIKQSIEQANSGEYVEVSSSEKIQELLGL